MSDTLKELEELANSLELDEECEDTEEPTTSEVIYVDPVRLDTGNVTQCKFDADKFQAGLNDFSYFAGAYNAMINAGLSNINAMNFVLSKLNIDMNKELTKMNNTATVEVSKNQGTLIDKTTL